MPRPFSSNLMLRYIPNAEESRCFQLPKMKEFELDFEGKWDIVAKRWMQ